MDRTTAIYDTLDSLLKAACDRYNTGKPLAPKVLILDFTNPEKVQIAELPNGPDFFRSTRSKHQLAHLIKNAFAKGDPTKDLAYATVVEAWAVMGKGIDATTVGRPSEHPERKDVISCSIHLRDGTRGHMALIEGKPPRAVFQPAIRDPNAMAETIFDAPRPTLH